MGRKATICVQNVGRSVPLTLTQTITSNAVQTVTFKNNSKNFVIANPIVTFDKNNLSNVLTVTGRTSGNYNMNYVVRGNYTNQIIDNHVNIDVINENPPNGFIKNTPACGNFLYIYENNEYLNGSVLCAYTANTSAHTLRFASSNTKHPFKIIAIDQNNNEVVYTSAPTANMVPYRYVRVRVLTTTATNAPTWNEVRVFAVDNPSVNLALSRSTTATYNYPAYESPAAVDGNVSTRWSSTGPGAQNFTVDLTAAKIIQKVDIVRSVYDAMTSYSIQASNNNVNFDLLFTSGTFNGYPNAVTEGSILTANLTGQSISINLSAGSNGLWKFVPASEFIVAASGSLYYIPNTTLTFIADSQTIDTVDAYYQGIGYMSPNDCIIPAPEPENSSSSSSSSSNSSSSSSSSQSSYIVAGLRTWNYELDLNTFAINDATPNPSGASRVFIASDGTQYAWDATGRYSWWSTNSGGTWTMQDNISGFCTNLYGRIVSVSGTEKMLLGELNGSAYAWATLAQPPVITTFTAPFANAIVGHAYDNEPLLCGQSALGGANSRAARYSNGTWEVASLATASTWGTSMCKTSNGTYVIAISEWYGKTSEVRTSTDFVTWSSAIDSQYINNSGVANGAALVPGPSGVVVRTIENPNYAMIHYSVNNGSTWSDSALGTIGGTGFKVRGAYVAYLNKYILPVNSALYHSSNGNNWTYVSVSSISEIADDPLIVL
jgi:hypothetical protein